MDRKKIENKLQSLKFFEIDNRIYFKTLSGYIVSLSKERYFERKRKLAEYFDKPDWSPKDQKRLILENLQIGAVPLPEKEYYPKIELCYNSIFCQVYKISEYPPELDGKDVDSKSLREKEKEVFGDPWRTERNDWLTTKALEVRDWLRRITT